MIWMNDGKSSSWEPQILHKFNDVVWHVSWSITGNILAVSGGDNKVCRMARQLVNHRQHPRSVGRRQQGMAWGGGVWSGEGGVACVREVCPW